MISTKLKSIILLFFCIFISHLESYAQQGEVAIHQDKSIEKLMRIKKELNKSDSERYKIQIYSGNRSDAYEAQKEFKDAFENWPSIIQYETPNFKIWAGNFRTRLEADRALKQIKGKFPAAFIFRPKK
ncbi:SPOR domain-containing protein [Tamlana fucoidanivorans]|uniref:SPOR domain-containing protein n=1 Tax=Allotamlana fucoidanivorans TaxID=2583814 RepID=A0A5C4SKE4_9FLAO|nr:SPOR domain-containing protein [Tamlana fucoidanivorans]TNJ44323.1 SPOR domain-containing protein [Tamlana fucoidanivorans]